MEDLRLTRIPATKTGMLIRKPAAEVFDAIVNPDITTKFWFSRSSGRLELADAIVTDSASLAARVMVNRVWLHLFGRGVVPTAEDGAVEAVEDAAGRRRIVVRHGDKLRAQTHSHHRDSVLYGRTDDGLFPAKKRIAIFVGGAHWAAENDERSDMLPVLGRHFSLKKPDRTVVRALLFQYVRKKPEVLKGVVLKNQDLLHWVLADA